MKLECLLSDFLNDTSYFFLSIFKPFIIKLNGLHITQFSRDSPFHSSSYFNPFRANPIKWSNTLKQFIGKLPTHCLIVFDDLMGLMLKGLTNHSQTWGPQLLVSFSLSLACNFLLVLGTSAKVPSSGLSYQRFAYSSAFLFKSISLLLIS